MTTNDGFERLLGDWLVETASPIAPEGLHDGAMERARRSRQRPAWIAGLRVGTVGRRATRTRFAVRRGLLVAVLILLLGIVAFAAIVGSRPRLPPPFGLAANGLLAFDSGGRIYLVDGNRPVLLPNQSSATENTTPIWSPDGRRLAFWSKAAADKYRLSIVAERGSNSIETPVYGGVAVEAGVQSSWSPDGRHLVFSGSSHGGKALFVAGADGAPVNPLLRPEQMLNIHLAINPAWSPDGAWIAFVGVAASSSRDVGLYVIPRDGGTLQRLATSPLPLDSLEALVPRWAPDPDRLALLYAFGEDGKYDIGVFDVKARHETVVSSEPSNDFWPTWSPDATRVAWYAGDAGRDSIKAASVSEAFRPSDVHSVLQAPAPAPGEGPYCADTPSLAGRFICSPPTWSPDGRSIYGFDVVGTSVLVMSVDGSAEIQRTQLEAGTGGGSISMQRVAP